MPSSFLTVLVRLEVKGMHRVNAFSPFFTYRPSSFHNGKMASGPGRIPRAKHWNKAKS